MNHPPKILVVDDTQVNRVVLNRALTKAGYQVIEAEDGYAAVEMARAEEPDLILLDVMMPDRDGFEACRDLKADPLTDQIPVIFVTAVTEAKQIVNAFDIGGQDYIAKPFKMAEVLARISVHLKLRQTEEALRLKNEQLEELAAEMTRVSRIDPLTRINNRRAWVDQLKNEHERYMRGGRPYSICVIDVDCFKSYNDSLGHPAGDRCLVAVAQAIDATCRRVDLVGRYGGEEFVVLMPETTSEEANRLAERIRKAIWHLGIPHPSSTSSTRVTASLGVAGLTESWEETLRRADDAMYVAKRAGRNMVFSAENLGLMMQENQTLPEETEIQQRVLIVDPDPTSRAVCGGALRRSGYIVEEVKNAREAHEVVSNVPPDLMLMELALPDDTGIEFARQLRAQFGPDCPPLVLMSARSATADALRGLEAGADEFIAKPVHAAELVLRVRALTRLRREHQDLVNEHNLRGGKLRVLSRLVEYCRTVGASNGLDEIYRRTAEAAADLVRCSRVAILTPADNGRHLEVTSTHGLEVDDLKDIEVPFGEPICGEVYATGRKLTADDDTQHTYDLPLRVSGPMLAVPLSAQDSPLGVLCAAGREHDTPFEPTEVEYVELIARMAATVADTMTGQQAHMQVVDSIMVALAKLAEHRDADTNQHVDRVTEYCMLLAHRLQQEERFRDRINGDFISALRRAAPLHDIGKVAIPETILMNPGRLSPADMRVMRTHASIGANTIQSLIDSVPGADFLQMAADIARYHHERFDGSGYPAGLSGDSIPLAARIVAVADMYDGLTTARVYKAAVSHDEAAQEVLTAAGSQLDPDVVSAFQACEEDFRSISERADVPTPELPTPVSDGLPG